MAVLSGRKGTLYIGANEIVPLSNWRLVITSSHRVYTANDTGRWRKRVPGAKDCTGSFVVAVCEGGNSPVQEGRSLTLKLHVDDSGSNYYEVGATIDRTRIEMDIGNGQPIALRIEFSGNGCVTPCGILAIAG